MHVYIPQLLSLWKLNRLNMCWYLSPGCWLVCITTGEDITTHSHLTTNYIRELLLCENKRWRSFVPEPHTEVPRRNQHLVSSKVILSLPVPSCPFLSLPLPSSPSSPSSPFLSFICPSWCICPFSSFNFLSHSLLAHICFVLIFPSLFCLALFCPVWSYIQLWQTLSPCDNFFINVFA